MLEIFEQCRQSFGHEVPLTFVTENIERDNVCGAWTVLTCLHNLNFHVVLKFAKISKALPAPAVFRH